MARTVYVGGLPENLYRVRIYHGMPRVRGRNKLDRIISYLHRQAQDAGSQEEYELASVILRFLGEIKRGTPVPDAWPWAWSMAVGLSEEKYRLATAERRAFTQHELDKCIPDYDPREARSVRQIQQAFRSGQSANGGSDDRAQTVGIDKAAPSGSGTSNVGEKKEPQVFSREMFQPAFGEEHGSVRDSSREREEKRTA